MGAAAAGALARAVEEEARPRFGRWDGSLWADLVKGPATELFSALQRAGVPEAQARPVFESYLRLAAEGIGLGYLFRDEVGANFFTLAWRSLLPLHLASLPAGRQAEVVAQCFNLGENLERSPAWLRRIFVRLCRDLTDLGDLGGLVERVSQRALEPPEAKLPADLEQVRVLWKSAAEEDVRFLPGRLHFLAPTVLCIHDRLRTAAGGREAATVGLWLDEKPLLLGPLSCTEAPADDNALEVAERAQALDPRALDGHAAVRNEWRAALSLQTSQFVVALLP